jgi:hypothetical protein
LGGGAGPRAAPVSAAAGTAAAASAAVGVDAIDATLERARDRFHRCGGKAEVRVDVVFDVDRRGTPRRVGRARRTRSRRRDSV